MNIRQLFHYFVNTQRIFYEYSPSTLLYHQYCNIPYHRYPIHIQFIFHSHSIHLQLHIPLIFHSIHIPLNLIDMTGCRVSILSIFHQSPKKAFFQEKLIFFAALISLLYQYISIYIYISVYPTV